MIKDRVDVIVHPDVYHGLTTRRTIAGFRPAACMGSLDTHAVKEVTCRVQIVNIR